MQDLNANLYRKYTGLKKRKLLDEGSARELESDIKEMCQGMKEMEGEIHNLRSENNRLRDELLSKERQLAETRTLLVDTEHQLAEIQAHLADSEEQLAEARKTSVDDTKTKEFGTEISRLKLLLAEKNDTNNYTVPSGVIRNHTPVSRARTPESNNRLSNPNAIVQHGTFRDEARELECCRRNMRISGNGADESSSCVYQMLAESLVGMKFSLKNEMEGFSLCIYHEASGYNFTLTWLEQADGGEWAYKYSSLGTLEKIALEWMKMQDIRFSMTMCRVFFQRISGLIRQGRR
ncbi:uncharacterized protein LOC124663777 [Lolium rigidum]|uniref:uncharacterized protein LOC124663777 n=1 Tax=Lolium rigidum TaxID=89674 RepID=UPI001F5D5A01|nr:uncharacterized protein LOC124663777 [Lolium rigidum]